MTLGEIIKQFRTDHEMSMDTFAKLSGISKSYISLLEKNEHPKTKKSITPAVQIIKQASVAMHMDFDTLFNMIEGDVDISSNTNKPASAATSIYVYGRVAAGIPFEMITDIIDTEEISAEMAKSGEYFGLQIHGDSMEPKISDGDVVIVRKQEEAESGETVIVTVNGTDATCKRLKKYEDGIALISTNPSYAPMYYSRREIEEKPVRIIGKVVELRAKF